MVLIREEEPGDFDTIREVNRLAFAGDIEARLVDQLRDESLVIASLVAIANGEIVGHVLFSDLPITTSSATIPAASLAPIAVKPAFQRRGIGAEMIRRGLELCRERGKLAVIVLGHPGYYPRFGFSCELARRIRSPYSGEAWMALELVPDVLRDVEGAVQYPEAFNRV